MKPSDAVPGLFQALEDEHIAEARQCSEVIAHQSEELPEITLTPAQVRQVARFVYRFLHIPRE